MTHETTAPNLSPRGRAAEGLGIRMDRAILVTRYAIADDRVLASSVAELLALVANCEAIRAQIALAPASKTRLIAHYVDGGSKAAGALESSLEEAEHNHRRATGRN